MELINMPSGDSFFGVAGGGGSSSDYSGGSSSFDSGFDFGWDSSSSHSSSSNGLPSFGAFIVWAVIIISIVMVVKSEFKDTKNTIKNKTKDIKSTGNHVDNFGDGPLKLDPKTIKNNPEDPKIIQELTAKVEKVFLKYQEDWSNFNREGMRAYMTDKYYNGACLMLDSMQAMGRQNKVSNIHIREVSISNNLQKTETAFLATIRFSCVDELYDTKTEQLLLHDQVHNLEEIWEFQRDQQNNIKLNNIHQPSTVSNPHFVPELRDFAEKKQLFYSQDWGRYALPTQGLIFSDAGLRKADVNNHIVGRWDQILFQMYTYSPTPDTPDSYWLVGQLTVPKKYCGIILKHHDAPKFTIPKGYQKYELEWEEFNKKYNVWATEPDKITSFELLNPKFMEYLYDHELAFNLEVVGDNIYFFAPVLEQSERDYAVLLDILAQAYRELER